MSEIPLYDMARVQERGCSNYGFRTIRGSYPATTSIHTPNVIAVGSSPSSRMCCNTKSASQRLLLGPYSRTMPRFIQWTWRGLQFRMSEIPLYDMARVQERGCSNYGFRTIRGYPATTSIHTPKVIAVGSNPSSRMCCSTKSASQRLLLGPYSSTMPRVMQWT